MYGDTSAVSGAKLLTENQDCTVITVPYECTGKESLTENYSNYEPEFANDGTHLPLHGPTKMAHPVQSSIVIESVQSKRKMLQF